MADAISANTALNHTHFNSMHTYRLEWEPGDPDFNYSNDNSEHSSTNGYMRWYVDDEFIFGIDGSALNVTGSMIPSEPMYLIMNTAISSTWVINLSNLCEYFIYFWFV